jgi:hypothetical protein
MTATAPMVQFGNVTFSGDDIIEALVIEECDQLSASLPIGTLELSLYANSEDFKIINPGGDFADLEYHQPLSLYETIDGSPKFIGQFFLDKWENTSEVVVKFSCVDIIGILDTLTYDGGIWLTPVNMGDLLQEMFDAIGISYILDPDLYDFPISGWIPICSYREALQQIAFAAGAFIICARQNNLVKIGKNFLSGVIVKGIRCGVAGCGQSRIYQQRWRTGIWGEVAPEYVINKADEIMDTPLTLKPQITGVEVTLHDIMEGTGSLELYNGTLTAGEHRINFNQPMHDLSVSGASISESGANYAILDVAMEGTVILSGLVYIDTTKKSAIYNEELGGHVKMNVLTITDATLVNSTNGDDVTQRIYDYYQRRYLQKVKLIAPLAATSNMVLVDSFYDKQIEGVIEKMNINLTGGFIVDTEIAGEVYVP